MKTVKTRLFLSRRGDVLALLGRHMRTILLTLSVVALFSACTNGEKMSSLEPGMTRQQVVGMLGRPDAVRSSGPYEQLEYTHRLITGWSWDRSDFNVILKDGRLFEFGHGEIRDRSPLVSQNRCLASADRRERNSSRHAIRYVQLGRPGCGFNDAIRAHWD